MALALHAEITTHGMNQGDLVRYLANIRDLVNELQTNYGATLTLANGLRSYILGNRIVAGKPGLARSTNFDVATGAILYTAFAGALLSVASGAVCDTGTAATFPAGKWGIFNVSCNSSGTLTATWATAASAGYTSEALAIAALPATPAGEVSLGYVTVRAHASNTFTAGSDALASGTGGNAAQTTTYYDSTALDPASAVGAALSSLTNSTALTLKRG